MKDRLQQLRIEALEQLNQIKNVHHLQDLRVKFLGKKGKLTEILRSMGNLSPEERPLIGQIANEIRTVIEKLVEDKQCAFQRQEIERRLQEEVIDVTLPGRTLKMGAIHPLQQVIEQIENIFMNMGYSVVDGPEVEQDYYNFEALRLPPDHPARDMQDSFYITERLLMRTQTSPVQVRTMEKMKGEVPVKIICPGRVYRRDDDDATHSFMFHQMEGLVIDRHVRMSDLKGMLLQFAQEMFGKRTEIRLRPSFFPFTEPSVEVDVTCINCSGTGCRICKQTGWIEILGAGMVHPRVLEMGGYDEQVYTGFAFGMGIERISMLKYGIDDIRHFYMNDIHFLQQFTQI